MSEVEDKQNMIDPGIFITKGMQVGIPEIKVSIGKDGKPRMEPITLHLGIDMCPYWIDIAMQHLFEVEKCHKILMYEKEKNDAEGMGAALESEFLAGMQCIMASSVAMDSYYAAVKDHIDIPEKLTQKWRENTARYKQIAEVIRRAFPLSKSAFRNLRDVLKQNTSFRDQAVHPSTGTAAPMVHVELGKATDWRYATFRFYNAKTIIGLTLSVIYQTANNPYPDKYDSLRKYCDELVIKLQPRLELWESKYDKLF